MRDASLRSGGTSCVMKMLVRLVLTRVEYQWKKRAVQWPGGWWRTLSEHSPIVQNSLSTSASVIPELHTAFGPCGCEERRKGD